MGQGKAGWAETQITPPLGLPMGGRGPRSTPGANVLDPLLAQALAMEDAGGRRTLWISLDLIGMVHPRSGPLRRLLADITATPLDSVLINFSHTHSGPFTHFEKAAWLREKPSALIDYERWLDQQIVHVALEACDRLSPASIHWHEGESTIAVNRRLPDEQGQMKMAPNPRGTLNRELWALHLETTHGSAIAFAHACHPVIVYGHAWDGISADFPGQCRLALRERFGENVHCQFFQGFAGNVRPRALADTSDPANPHFRKSEPGDATAVGRTLAADVSAALETPGEPVTPALSSAHAHAMLRRSEPPPLEHWQAQAESDNEFQATVAEYWLHRYRHGPPPARAQTWSVGVMMLDDERGIVHLGGEVLAEWLPLIRAWLPDRRLMAWGYTQEVAGYLPTDALLPEGGYEVSTAPINSITGPGAFTAGIDEAIGDAIRAAGHSLTQTAG